MAPAELPIDGVFDIETQEWTTFVLGGVMTADRAYQSFREEDDLLDRLLTLGGHFWTWNGGLFDSLWLCNRLKAKGLRVVNSTAGPRVTRLECEGLVVHDGFALFPAKLSKAARIAGLELSKDTGLPCRCKKPATPCGGYCSIRRGMPEAFYKKLDAYLKLDNHAVLEILQALIAEAERCGYDLAGTVGAAAYKTIARLAELEPARWSSEDHKTIEAARFGGRTEVFRPVMSAGHSYDINSAYPDALTRIPLPTGNHLRVTGDKARRAYRRGKEGVFVCRVRVPEELHFPPLPIRTPRGRIVYPVGSFRGCWTALELRAAESRGVDLQIDSGLSWIDAEPVLAAAFQHLWESRKRAVAEGAIGDWQKWFCNAPTGKLGERPEKERIVINPRQGEVKECECRWRPRKRRDCRCGAWRPLDREGQVWSAPFWRISGCAHVHWSTYLMAATRVKLLDQLEDELRSAGYCDTDGLKAIAPRTRSLGLELGQWKDEGRFTDFLALAPKVYRYWDVAKREWVVRGKGLPGLDRAGFDAFARGEPIVIERGVYSLRRAARSESGSLFQRRKLVRRNHADGVHFGGRVLRPDGMTYPRTLQEIQEWENQL